MASTYMATPYTTHTLSHYGYTAAPQPPPSPPIDEASRCSLPSISSLLDLADGSSPQEQPLQQQLYRQPLSPPLPHHHGPKVDDHPASTSTVASRSALPPTPPLHSDAVFDDRSPSASSTSSYSVVSAPSTYYASSTAVTSLESQRQQSQPLPRRISMPATTIAYPQPPFTHPHFALPHSQASYYPPPVQPPAAAAGQISGLYYQRALPQQYAPSLLPLSLAMPHAPGANPWQHHHYISPSAAAAFPPSQDRYVCRTCHKAFSRPSSLRIHGHSHTGEKPFKCSIAGCGKAFSVRSNMKRHERGCHTYAETMLR